MVKGLIFEGGSLYGLNLGIVSCRKEVDVESEGIWGVPPPPSALRASELAKWLRESFDDLGLPMQWERFRKTGRVGWAAASYFSFCRAKARERRSPLVLRSFFRRPSS